MSTLNPSDRYSKLSIILHWLMALVIVATFLAIELRENYPRGSDIREAFKTWHFMLGLSVLGLVIVRIAARLMTPSPAELPEPAWRKWTSKATHLALYALMLGLPIAGWLILSAAGKPIPFFGLELPPLIGPNKDLAGEIKELHELGAEVGLWLVGFHALAALFHHYVLKDGVLLRMMPRRGA